MMPPRRFAACARLLLIGLASVLTACGGGGDSGSTSVTAPAISAQPQSSTVSAGQTASFSVTATGTAPLTYQWLRNGAAISGASAATYTTPATTSSDSGAQYDVVVSNAGGSVTSSAVTLAVTHTLGLIAGGLGGLGHADAPAGPATAASFYSPAAVATDAAGNVYVADSNNNTIRIITPAGIVTTLAGAAGTTGSTDATGASARFNSPQGIAVDAAGTTVYVADTGNNTIRKIVVSTATVTTLAGDGVNGYHDDPVGLIARFDTPRGLAVDASGNVYVADCNNDDIRVIAPAGTHAVTTLAGTHGTPGSTDAAGTMASFYFPSAVTVDPAGNLYVADSFNSTIRKIVISSGQVTTLAGTVGTGDSVDGTGAAAHFNGPAGVAFDAVSGNIYVADTGNETIRKVTAAGAVTTLAGAAGVGGYTNGTGSAAHFAVPVAVATDAAGNVLVADSTNNLIRKITPGAVVTTFAGNLGGVGYVDGAAGTTGAARFNNPHNVTLGPSGILYVADQGNNVIRKIANGAVTTLAGSVGSAGVGSADGTGASAQFNQPFGIAVDSQGNLFVADSVNNTIRKIAPAGVVSTFAGAANASGSADGTGAAAQFNKPQGIAIDASNNVYVADCGNNTVRKITPAGVVTTLAGTAGVTGSADGTGTAAAFNCPHGLAVSSTSSNLYVADRFNDTIRKITPAGVVTTIAGSAGQNDFVDGAGSAAHFSWPGALAVDNSTGDLYVTDYLHRAVRRITPANAVTTVVGYAPGTTPAPAGVMLGDLPGALSGPTSIVVVPGSSTQLIFSDALENAILLATLP